MGDSGLVSSAISAEITRSWLTEIWERLFERAPVSPDDDFFALGGTPETANLLFEQIALVSGRELSPLTIYQAPTIAAISAILEARELPRFPAVVPLKIGNPESPIFMVHGLGGSVMEFFRMVGHLRFERSIFGLHRKGIDGWDQPFTRVEDLATHYINAVRAIQPSGPYYFVGFSLGGLIALEMAQQAKRGGDGVAFLAMIETFPHWKYLRLREKAKVATSLAKRLRDKALYRVRGLDDEGGDKCQSVGDYPRIGPAFAPIMERSGDSDIRMWKRYRPKYYPGTIHFFVRTEGGAKFPKDPRFVWAPLAQEFVVESIPGDHLGVMSRNFETLADKLSRRIALLRA